VSVVIKINVYDFDNTIYKGESTLDFYFYCVRRHPVLLKYVSVIAVNLVKYKLCIISEEQLMSLCKKYVAGFLHDCPDARRLAVMFWEKNSHKLKAFYNELHKEDDVIISASFGFLLRPVMQKLGVSNLVCSEVNFDNGEIEKLCFRQYKKDLFLENFNGCGIENFYTDSLNDMPLMMLAKKAYLVKGERITEYVFEKR